MKTVEQLKNRIIELGKQAAQFSQQAVEISQTNREQGRIVMQQAREASRRCQLLIQELKRQSN